MSNRKPALWSTMRSDDGTSIVVPEDADATDALLEMLVSECGGDFTRDNPVVQREAAGLKVELWRSCSKAYRENEAGIDPYCEDWWAPDGDGKRTIHVVYYDGAIWALHDEAEEAKADG